MQLDRIGDIEEEPVKENHAVRLATPPMLIILHRKDDAQGGKREERGPETEVGKKGLRLGFGLHGCLKGRDEEECGEDSL